MKRETKYQPIYSDILESQKQTGNAEKINGVSYLPGELSDQERSQFQEIKKERRGVILFTVFSCILSIAAAANILIFLIYALLAVGFCLLVRYAILKRPLHKEAYPFICIILTGILPYLILTSRAKNYFDQEETH